MRWTAPALLLTVLVSVLLVACSKLDAPGAVVRVQGESYAHGYFDTAQHPANPVVINFWYPSCPPCVYELPAFQNAYERFGDQVVFVGLQAIQLDSPEEGHAFLRQLGITYPNLADTDYRGITEFMLEGYPATLFLDRQHRIVMRTLGTLDDAQLVAIINKLLD